jgi:hypothetical protein
MSQVESTLRQSWLRLNDVCLLFCSTWLLGKTKPQSCRLAEYLGRRVYVSVLYGSAGQVRVEIMNTNVILDHGTISRSEFEQSRSRKALYRMVDRYSKSDIRVGRAS